MPLILADAMHLVQDRFLVQSAGTHAVAGAVSFCCNNILGAIRLDSTDKHVDLAAVAMHHLRMMRLPAFMASELTHANSAVEVVYRLS